MLWSCGGEIACSMALGLSGEGLTARALPASSPPHLIVTLHRFGENVEMKAIELAHALEQSRAIPLDQIASIAMDHKRQLAFVQLHTGTEVQLEASGCGDLIQKLTELYSGSYNA
jgi:hypothetical protein